ncbi:MAG: hypothetical protein WA584_11525 [Pyrinomonadaceae bacterium]
MKDIDQIIEIQTESLKLRYLNAIDTLSNDDISNIPVEEITSLAAKLKRKKLTQLGLANQIAAEAEEYYTEQLKQQQPHLYKNYILQKNQTDKAQKKAFFSKLYLIFPDTDLKNEYIENKLKFDLNRDKSYLIQACHDIAYRRTQEEVENFRKMFERYAVNADHFEKYLNAVMFLKELAISILFQKELFQIIAKGFSVEKIRLIFYKCLRLTHEGGVVGFCDSLEDHFGLDKNGNKLKFLGEADLHQLDVIKNIIQNLSELGVVSQNILIVSDFDLLKFKGYKIPRTKIERYVENIEKYIDNKDINTYLDTQYFRAESFETKFTEICESIRKGNDDYIKNKEFLRIEEDYYVHFSKTMKNWTYNLNHHYSVNSVARNIAEGIYLSDTPSVIFIFEESLVNGKRFNLAVKNQIPFLGLKKMKAKVKMD